jgi:hypothetical protein
MLTETLVVVYQHTQYHNPEDHNINCSPVEEFFFYENVHQPKDRSKTELILGHRRET